MLPELRMETQPEELGEKHPLNLLGPKYATGHKKEALICAETKVGLKGPKHLRQVSPAPIFAPG